MDNAFLQYLLFLCLALILIVYLYQNKKPQMKNLHISLIGGDLAEDSFNERV